MLLFLPFCEVALSSLDALGYNRQIFPHRGSLRAAGNLLFGSPLTDMIQRVTFFKLLKLRSGVELEELIDALLATSNLDQELFSLNFNSYALGSELIDTCLETQEHDLHLLAIG